MLFEVQVDNSCPYDDPNILINIETIWFLNLLTNFEIDMLSLSAEKDENKWRFFNQQILSSQLVVR